MVSIIRTSIYANDMVEFRNFLEELGFSQFYLFPSDQDGLYLNIHFENKSSLFTYRLRDVEGAYKDLRSNTYYYDLDQNFDDEAADFFGDDDEYN